MRRIKKENIVVAGHHIPDWHKFENKECILCECMTYLLIPDDRKYRETVEIVCPVCGNKIIYG